MRRPLNRFKTSWMLAASAVALSCGSTIAYAQESNEDDAKTLDTIVVTGYKQSLADALALKRDSGNITDAISAEDIGKSADQNIAEALQRVTGISISREDGEGTSITARGIGSNLNNVTLNGVPLTSSGDSQGVNFSEFSSDILQNIEVQKTPSASTNEGSLGASIKLSGFKPLNAKKDRRVIEYQHRYNEFSDDQDYKAQIALSEKFLDDKFGVSAVLTNETQGGRRDRVETNRWSVYNNFRNGANVDGLGVVRAYDANGDGVIETDQSGNGGVVNNGELLAWAPNTMFYHYETTQRDRLTGQLALQFKMWEGSDINVSYTKSKQNIARDRSFISVNTQNGNADSDNQLIDPYNQNMYSSIKTAFPNTQEVRDSITNETRGSFGNADELVRVWRHGRYISEDVQESDVFSIDAKQDWGEFTFNLKGGYSSTSQDDEFGLRSFWRARRTWSRANEPLSRSGLAAGYTCDNPQGDLLCRITQNPGNPDFVNPQGLTPTADQIPVFDNGDLFEPQTFIDDDRFSTDDVSSLYFDTEWHRSFGPISSLEAGLKWQSREKVRNSTFVQYGNSTVEGRLSNVRLDDWTIEQSPDDFAETIGLPRDETTNGFNLVDIRGFYNSILEDGASDVFDNTTFDPLVQSSLKEEVAGGYLQANFSFADDRIYGDFGVRYVETDITGLGGSLLQFDSNQGFLSEGNRSFYGYSVDNDGNPLATNTRTLEEADALIRARFFPLVGIHNDYAAATAGVSATGQTARFNVAETNSYNNTLPSLNVNFLATDDIVVRFAASEQIARPEFNRLFPNFRINEQIFGDRSNGNIGATNLTPYKTQNLDLSAEWYFDEGSLFSVALFNKKVEDFVQNNRFESYYQDVRAIYYDVDNQVNQDPTDPDSALRALPFTAEEVVAMGNGGPTTGILIPVPDDFSAVAGCMPNRENDLTALAGAEDCDVVALSTTINGSGGYIRGIETSLQHNFDDLPGIWGGLGFQANYTYVDSEQDAQGDTLPATAFENTSEHTFNAQLFWEQNGHLVRLAYNSRSDYLVARAGSNEMSYWNEGTDDLSMSGNFKITDGLMLNFQAVNLLDTVTRQYATVRADVSNPRGVLPAESSTLGDQPTGRTRELISTGRIFRVGLRYSF